jgi:hypothetical protein
MMFAPYIGTEYHLSKANPGGATFAHHDLDGNFWTYERKGKKEPGAKRSFSQMAKGDHLKRLAIVGDWKTAENIYVVENVIDGFSIAQHDGLPKNTAIVSTFGNPSYAGLRDLMEIAKVRPNAKIQIAMDNDSSGRGFAETIEQVVQLGRGAQGTTISRVCDDRYKDWNDQIRGIVPTVDEKRQDENKIAALEADRTKGRAEAGAKRPSFAQTVRKLTASDEEEARLKELNQHQETADERRRRMKDELEARGLRR